MPSTHRVVVDGSNLATEGRTIPSLAQLDEAVRAYLIEDPDADIVVVVDASFSHRIDPGERAQLEAAELHGELVAPPAGAIGRGDAFVLRIAERTGAIVLSNDSFQEFHEEHPWLFDDGRLVGGKPVPGVGWIFTPRRPVRGPRSRKARETESADHDGDELSAPRKAAEVAKALKEVATGGRAKAAAKAADAKGAKKKAAKDDGSTASARKGVARQPAKSGKADLKAERVKPVKAVPTRAAAKAKDHPKDQKEGPGSKRAKRAEKAVGPAASTPKPKEAAKDVRATKAVKATKEVKAAKAIKIAKSAKTTKAAKKAQSGPRPVGIRAAIDSATQEVLEPMKHSAELAASAKPKRRRRAEPPPAVNEPLAFINFVASHPLGSVVEGVVGSFTSQGAMVEVPMPDGGVLHCYAPLVGLGSPPPRAAREVLKRGERRDFTLIGLLNPPRRMAELALPEFRACVLGCEGPRASSGGLNGPG